MAERKGESGKRGTAEVAVSRRQTPSRGLSRWGFTSPFSLIDDMSRLFGYPHGRDVGEGWVPQVDVLRRGGNLVVRADLPGLSKDDISIDVTDSALTIRGERREEKKEEREGYYWHERSEGSFYRSIPLPDGADVDRADARFENGVLEVTLPAPSEEQPRGRRIEIR